MFPSYSEVIPPNMDEKDVQIPKISILRLFFVLVVSIIISDASVQIIFAYLPLQFPLNSVWLDIFLHAALTIPVIYVFANRPMKELLGKLSETSKFADLTNDKLIETNELLTSLLKFSPIYVFTKEVTPQDSRFLKVSDNFREVSGINSSDMIGKSMHDIFPADFSEKIIADDWKIFSTGEVMKLDEQLNGRKYSTIKFPFKIGEKNILGGFTIDITERENAVLQTENMLNSLKVVEKDLREKNTELEHFTYTVSHDLKSPLITIKGYCGGVLKDFAAGRTDRFEADMKRVMAAADKMMGLLEDLLQLSRIGRIINPPTEFRLADVVADTLALLAGPISERNVHVAVHALPVVYADKTRIREVIQNLIENAIKFSDVRSDVVIEIGQQVKMNGDCVLYVRDNGKGIDPRYLETIFGLFNKLDTVSVGSGIGLALVRRIIEIHGGKVWCESNGIGTGSVFYFTIPIIQ